MKNILVLSLVLAMGVFTLSGCETAGKKTGIGAGVGAVLGAGVGAVIGHQSGKRGEGAAIGAALGGAIGGGAGYYLDKQAKELAEVAETRRTEHGIVTKLKGDILFASGSAGVQAPAQQNITKIAQIIRKYPEDILTVKGHTDSTGSAATNQALSASRAEAVRALIVAQGVPASSVTAIGIGESTPLASNKTSAGRSQNRRVEIEIRVDESKLNKKK